MIKYHFKKDYLVYLAVVILLVVGGFWGYFHFFDNQSEIINEVIVLRNNQDNVLVKSQLISEIDQWVVENDNRNLEAEWYDIVPCLKKGCTDARYLGFIATLAREEKPKFHSLITNLVTAYAVWGSTDQVVDFSKAIANSQELVDDTQSRRLEDAWDAILECNNACAQRDELFFGMIEEIVKQ